MFCHHVFTFCIINSFLFTLTLTSPNCCGDTDELLTHAYSCFESESINLKCDGYLNILSNNSSSSYSHYIMTKSDTGECVEAYMSGYRVCEPYFCTGKRRYNGYGTKISVVVCSTGREYYTEINPNIRAAIKNPEISLTILIYFIKLMNVISFVALAIVTFVHLSELGSVDGACKLHLCLCLSLIHGLIAYKLIFGQSILPDMCITNLYLEAFSILASFSWTGILSHHLWSRCTQKHLSSDESNLDVQHYMVGYGIPIALILMANLHAHGAKLYSSFEFENLCYQHQINLIVYYMTLPLMITAITNVYFFIDLQTKIRGAQNMNLRSERSTMKKTTNKLAAHSRLFMITGIPWTLFIIVCITYLATGISFLWTCGLLLSALISSEGIFVFLISVALRSRIRNAILRKWFTDVAFIPQNWKTKINTDSVVDSDFEFVDDTVKTAENDEKRIENGSVSIIVSENT